MAVAAAERGAELDESFELGMEEKRKGREGKGREEFGKWGGREDFINVEL